MIQNHNKHMIFSKVVYLINYLYPRKRQHKKRYTKMIRMLSSKDDTTCDDKARCIAHWYDWIQMLLSKVTYNTRGNQWIEVQKDAPLHSKQKKRKNSCAVQASYRRWEITAKETSKIANINVTQIWPIQLSYGEKDMIRIEQKKLAQPNKKQSRFFRIQLRRMPVQ